tara:strand:- start:256 stop:1614 length:1359 start_codon:yes stop_codon:yes gene_type:complete
MDKNVVKILQFLMILVILHLMVRGVNTIEGFTMDDKQGIFQEFMENHYSSIFPDGGRNSGGPMFYHYFVNNMNLDKRHFNLYNQFYCGVSGSIVSPNRSGGNITNHIVLDDLDGNQWFGKYYRCCVPCLCDLMRYAKVEQHTVQLTDELYDHFVITIDDPCSNEANIPSQVTAFTCRNGITLNGERTTSGRLIIAVLFGTNEMDELPVLFDPAIHTIDGDDFCNQRICQAPTELRGGMGDIFVLLSLVGNSGTPPSPERFHCPDIIEPLENTDMLNIYGEPLEKCREDTNSSDQSGSWDSQGYCSELGGGVHQICFNVNNNTKDFSTDTNQSNWSLEREGKNHCMCIGAWALYKAKQDNNRTGDPILETTDELKCDAIPKVSLTDQYLNKWATWNGHELDKQTVNGVNELVEQCHEKAENNTQKQHLENLYQNLTSTHSEFSGEELLSFNQR